MRGGTWHSARAAQSEEWFKEERAGRLAGQEQQSDSLPKIISERKLCDEMHVRVCI